MTKKLELESKFKEIRIFVKEKFPEAQGALITGSYANRKAKKNSDIDLIIFSKNILQPFVEKIKIGELILPDENMEFKIDKSIFHPSSENIMWERWKDLENKYD